jgi:hypothetical protein
VSLTARFLWQVALGLAAGLVAVGLSWLFDSVWPGVVFLVAWIVGTRIWWFRRRPRRR